MTDRSPKEVADALGCSHRSVLRRIERGQIPAFRPWPGAPYVIAGSWLAAETARRTAEHARLAAMAPEDRRAALMATKAKRAKKANHISPEDR